MTKRNTIIQGWHVLTTTELKLFFGFIFY